MAGNAFGTWWRLKIPMVAISFLAFGLLVESQSLVVSPKHQASTASTLVTFKHCRGSNIVPPTHAPDAQ